MRYRSLILMFLILLLSCSNETKVKESKDEQSFEVDKIKKEKLKLSNEADSLSNEVEKLKSEKEDFAQNNKLAEADIYTTVKNSLLDHVIIGTKDLDKTSGLFKLFGFSIKNGREHQNGVRNNFIEFGDNSEIELIEINEPKDEISKNYKNLINENIFGLQFALRVNNIDKLTDSFKKLDFPFTDLVENNIYSTLSSKTINTELPIFFIQFNNENNNSIINHSNRAKGIKSVWFETKDIKKSAKQLVDLGFEPIGNYEIPAFKNKVVEFRNNNFGIILIESDKYQINGITILVEDYSNLKSILDKNNITFDEHSEKNIFVNPSQTKSIWIEFTK
ncbi:MAG: VOC family protein [Ignavibacteriales bacterium]|nr:VOC family protein [Ignavibacteriales bacterium]